jgi:fructosamine-3-kinase
VIEALREAGITVTIDEVSALSSAGARSIVRVRFHDHPAVVIKLNARHAHGVLVEEAAGLARLRATNTVRVPEVLFIGLTSHRSALVMEALETIRADEDAWERFGRTLAALHQMPVGARYGFDHDNHCGPTPQCNDWTDDWVEFNRRHRLGAQCDRAVANGVLHADEERPLRAMIAALDRYIPANPHPALLHGDLWSGNALPTRAKLTATGACDIAVIDPACSIGDGWADIAMMRLFGGFPRECEQAYAECIGVPEDCEQRITVYQLYHLLNHLNLFGRGYIDQVMSWVHRLR